ncbi:DUF2922 domain-containing protein (plasmid) [Psychrobacillus glaciei]|uniref:DUF2922 domain-containing protein n=1 Tax=Psychrobacillus glaciei TaxID=2283160 RepID=A0A5J6SUL0_9BACI|nr:DUF2922 domain-containing protein [Psychrobacillus glaciei]QFG01290.1 DUF2922 domain-containing protein [Psychrobacillus glaciei]
MSEKTRKVLQMQFNTAENKDVSIRLTDPKPDLTATTVQAAMELFNDLKVFNSISLMGPARLKGAKTVETVTSDFGITVG